MARGLLLMPRGLLLMPMDGLRLGHGDGSVGLAAHRGAGATLHSLPDYFSHRLINGAGVRLFFCDACFRQIVEDRPCFDLEFAGQFVDANLICVGHRPRGSFLLWLGFSRYNCFRRHACSRVRFVDPGMI